MPQLILMIDLMKVFTEDPAIKFHRMYISNSSNVRFGIKVYGKIKKIESFPILLPNGSDLESFKCFTIFERNNKMNVSLEIYPLPWQQVRSCSEIQQNVYYP